MNVYDELKKIRIEKNLRLDDVAKQMKCSKQYIHQIESGNASLAKINQLASLYGYRVEMILLRES